MRLGSEAVKPADPNFFRRPLFRETAGRRSCRENLPSQSSLQWVIHAGTQIQSQNQNPVLFVPRSRDQNRPLRRCVDGIEGLFARPWLSVRSLLVRSLQSLSRVPSAFRRRAHSSGCPTYRMDSCSTEVHERAGQTMMKEELEAFLEYRREYGKRNKADADCPRAEEASTCLIRGHRKSRSPVEPRVRRPLPRLQLFQ
jgi:hypothetical protein